MLVKVILGVFADRHWRVLIISFLFLEFLFLLYNILANNEVFQLIFEEVGVVLLSGF